MTVKQHEKFKNFFEVTHPLLQHKITRLRDIETDTKAFKELTKEITILLGYEVTKDLPIIKQPVKTPMEVFDAPVISGKKPVILAILRAGIGMVDGFLTLIPSARIAYVGLYRDEETLQPQLYYFKIPPNSKDRQFYVCDPMLATGGSAISALDKLKEAGIKKITYVCIVAAPEGVEKVCTAHPDVPVFAAVLDRGLNSKGYILPGLGDAGDRMFGTK